MSKVWCLRRCFDYLTFVFGLVPKKRGPFELGANRYKGYIRAYKGIGRAYRHVHQGHAMIPLFPLAGFARKTHTAHLGHSWVCVNTGNPPNCVGPFWFPFKPTWKGGTLRLSPKQAGPTPRPGSSWICTTPWANSRPRPVASSSGAEGESRGSTIWTHSGSPSLKQTSAQTPSFHQ